MLFSERNGLVKTLEEMSLPDEFRIATVTTFFNQYSGTQEAKLFFDLRNIMDYFGIIQRVEITDKATLVSNKRETLGYFASCEWNRVFDFIELVVSLSNHASLLEKKYDRIMQLHGIPYRMVQGNILPIVNEVELQSINAASQTGVTAVDSALTDAVKLLSSRPDPDYNAVIAKASNALEAMIIHLASQNGLTENTLGRAVNALKTRGLFLEQDLEVLAKSVYKYACNAGIRHGGNDPVEASERDALLVLVICSALINYIAPIRTTDDKNPPLEDLFDI